MPRTAERHRGMKMVAETASGCGSGCGMLLGEMACRVVGVTLALRARR